MLCFRAYCAFLASAGAHTGLKVSPLYIGTGLWQCLYILSHIRCMMFHHEAYSTQMCRQARDEERCFCQGKDSLKKADVANAAAAEDVPFSDAVYSRVIKELCDSRGSSWFLKTGV